MSFQRYSCLQRVKNRVLIKHTVYNSFLDTMKFTSSETKSILEETTMKSIMIPEPSVITFTVLSTLDNSAKNSSFNPMNNLFGQLFSLSCFLETCENLFVKIEYWKTQFCHLLDMKMSFERIPSATVVSHTIVPFQVKTQPFVSYTFPVVEGTLLLLLRQ